jgi:hypothetical protein
MRHARPDALDQLEEVLAALRVYPQLRERGRGVFYRGSKAFLHFHEDPEGLFADLRCAADFVRFRVTTSKERAHFLNVVRKTLREGSATG